MDPNACWLELIGSDDRDEIMEHAQNLDDWIRRGGFKPRAVNSRGEALRDDFRLTVGAITFFVVGGLIDRQYNC